MKSTRTVSRSSATARPASPAMTETLEGRRLFAAALPPSPPPDLGVPPGMVFSLPPRGAPAGGMWATLSGGGVMVVTVANGATTASSVAATSSAASSAPARADASAVSTTTVSAPTASVGRPVVPPEPVNGPAWAAARETVVRVAMDDAAGPVYRPAGVAALSPAVASDWRSGPFVIADAPTAKTATRSARSGLSNLVTSRRDDAATRLRRAPDAFVRARRVASGDLTTDADARIDVANTPAAVDAASLAAFVDTASVRPFWQRVAVMTAGAALVMANWALRRRRLRDAKR